MIRGLVFFTPPALLLICVLYCPIDWRSFATTAVGLVVGLLWYGIERADDRARRSYPRGFSRLYFILLIGLSALLGTIPYETLVANSS